MREVPECLNRRYKAVDDLIQQLTWSVQGSGACGPPPTKDTSDPAIKLMCEFWNILKEDPDCNLTENVKKRVGLTTTCPSFQPDDVTCYVTGGKLSFKDRLCPKHAKNSCGQSSSHSGKTHSSCKKCESDPLNVALGNLKQAASFDKNCNKKITELMDTQNQLLSQIEDLEQREKDGALLLKQADCMWSCMEDAYKKRLQESLERQNALVIQVKDVENSHAKWRKNKKDLELQVKSIDKYSQEINDQLNQKKNDIKCMHLEIADLTKRVESIKKDTEKAKNSINTKKESSDRKIANMVTEMNRVKILLDDESRVKFNKEKDGRKFVKEAREELQKICRALLRKKLKNEDLRAEKTAILEEINLLNETMDNCKGTCTNKQKSLINDIKILDSEIAAFKVKCIRCNECTDTEDVRMFCTDCPRCLEKRDCLYEDGICTTNSSSDCVCMRVKERFLDNVFENMYTVLERQSKQEPGKAVADAIVQCLKKSRNGKLNAETRRILQEFVLSTVNKNLNLTIVGGAVKTRCEMDPKTYKQLMLCLTHVKSAKPAHTTKDEGTEKKASCRHWGGTVSECFCPDNCACGKAADDTKGDAPEKEPKDRDKPGDDQNPKKEPSFRTQSAGREMKDNVGGEGAKWTKDDCTDSCCALQGDKDVQCVLESDLLTSTPNNLSSAASKQISGLENLGDDQNPKKEPSFRTQSAGREMKDNVGGEGAKWTKDDCTDSCCPFQGDKDVQCVLESDLLIATPNNLSSAASKQISGLENLKTCTCEQYQQHPSTGSGSSRSQPRERIIDEVMGRYLEVPIQKAKRNIKTSLQNTIIRTFTTQLVNFLDTEQVLVAGQSADKAKNVIKTVSYVKKHSKCNPKDIEKNNFSVTSSGPLSLALDEKEISKIDKKTSADTTVTLSKTDSGHFKVNLCPENDSIDDTYKVLVNKSASGTKSLEFHKINMNQHQVSADKNNVLEKTTITIEESIKIRKKPQTKKVNSSPSKSVLPLPTKNRCNLDANIIDFTDSRANTVNNLLKNYKVNETVQVKVRGENGPITQIKGDVTKTLSGNIAIHIQDFTLIGEMPHNAKGRAVDLNIIKHGLLDLNIDRNNTNPNAVVRKTSSGEVLVVLTKPVLTPKQKKQQCEHFKLKLKSCDCDEVDAPAILKSTPSSNCILVFEKEFEKEYKKVTDTVVKEDVEYRISLTKQSCGNYLINLDDSGKSLRTNASLVKTPSGNIKIFRKYSNRNIPLRPKTLHGGSQFIHDILDKFPRVNGKFCKGSLGTTSDIRCTKSKSAPILDKNMKPLSSSHTDRIRNSLTTLRKTNSGNYAVVLEKESKKAFINSIKSYLQNNNDRDGLVPVRMTKSGEIIVMLADDDLKANTDGFLKITPSGNIYVIIDENLVKLKDNETFNVNAQKNSTNTPRMTTCDAESDTFSCDCESSKHMSEVFQGNPTSWKHGTSEDKLNYYHKLCGLADYDESCKGRAFIENVYASRANKRSYDLKHIVIKPVSEEKPRSKENRFYVVEPVCQLHRDRYNSVSNELIEIPGQCEKPSKSFYMEVTPNIRDSNCSIWDSINYLPPQLPVFLSNLKY